MPSISDVIKRLRQLTEDEVLHWTSQTPPASIATATDSTIVGFFGVTYKHHNLGIYEDRFRGYDPDHDSSYWASRIALVFFDDSWNIAWEAPRVPGLDQLYDAIKYRAANVDAILKDIVDDSPSG
jgi:hypothetical protein